MLRFFFLGRVLRASVAPQGFALDSSLRWLFACTGSDRGEDDRLGDERVLSVLLPSRQAQPCQYEDVRREQNERLADLRDADPRGARGSPTRIWIDKPALSKALPGPTASRVLRRGALKSAGKARYKLSSQDIDLRVHLNWWRVRLQLPHLGQLPDG